MCLESLITHLPVLELLLPPSTAPPNWVRGQGPPQEVQADSEQPATPTAAHDSYARRVRVPRFAESRVRRIVICRWRKTKELATLPGPYIYGITRTSIRKLDDF